MEETSRKENRSDGGKEERGKEKQRETWNSGFLADSYRSAKDCASSRKDGSKLSSEQGLGAEKERGIEKGNGEN